MKKRTKFSSPIPMISKNRKTKKDGTYQNIVFSVSIGIFLLAIVGFLVVSNLKINQKRAELTEKIEELERDIRLFSERNEQLKAGIVRTESDDYWEAKLYEQGYRKPGEETVVIIPPAGEEETKTTKEKSFEENLSQIRENLLQKIGF